ncbi:MAG TPA: hypothetical protein VG167_03275 [Verrucomicrobiae bacterium]|nr:hypothetical protein [Verrucomicrobiae bacterium]
MTASRIALLLLGLLPSLACGQTGFEAQGFQVADHFDPPFQTQVKSLLKGERARPMTNGLTLVLGADLLLFRTNGEPELSVHAPQCFYNDKAKTAASAGPMQAQTADGKFSISGDGFLWKQTNSSLVVSNHVHSIVHPDLLTGAPGDPPRRPNNNSERLDIFSGHFLYSSDSGKAVYAQQAHVSGTNLDVTGSQLTLTLPQKDPQRPAGLDSILIETNVVVDYTNYTGTNATPLRLTGQRALYSTTNGLMHITGQPTWRAEQRHGRGDELTLDRTNKVFEANGHAWLEMPGQSLGGLLLASNSPAAQRPSTNRLVQIWSDTYQFHTNWAVFRDEVRVRESEGEQPRGSMNCGWMTAWFGTSNTLDRLVALTNVVIEQATNRFTGAQAVYTGTNGILELTGKPAWRSGSREGNGGLVRLNTQTQDLLVRTNAWLRLPAHELNETIATSTPGTRKSKAAAGPQFADVYCDEYVLSRDLGVFRGGVYVSHTNMNWACESMTVQAIPGGQVLTAEQGVVFDLMNDRGQKTHGLGDKAVYTNSIVGTVTNELLTLTGQPAVLISTNGTVENSVIIMDQIRGTVVVKGKDYRLSGTAKAVDTNLFTLPRNKPKK